MNTASNMIMIITYCMDRNIATAAVYLAHALFNSGKGFTVSINPGSKLFRHVQTLLPLLVDNQPVGTCLAPILI